MYYLIWFKRYVVLVLFKFLDCVFFPLLAGRFSDFHLTQNRKKHYYGLMYFLELRKLEIRSFPHFSLTCFDILSWNFANVFVLLYYRSSLSVVNSRQCLWELCPFWSLEYWKYAVFRTFILNALTYWAEILHMILFYCTTDQVICINFCRSNAPFGT